LISGNSNNNQITKIFGYTLPFFLTLLFLFLAFKNIDLKQSFEIILHSSIPAILLYIAVFYASHMARAIRWKFMTDSVKKDITFFHLFGSVMVSYGVSCVVPRLGELYRGLFLGRWEGISRSTVVGTIVVERIIDIAMFLLAALISVAIYSGDMLNEITWLRPSIIIGMVLLFIAIIFLIMLVMFKEKFSRLLNKLTEKVSGKFAKRLIGIFETLVSGLNSIKGTKNIIGIIIWSAIIIMLYTLNSYVGFFTIGFHTKVDISFQMAFILMTISSFGVMIPTPGGTGPYHMISIFILTRLYKFDYEGSAAYSILTHFISYVGFIFSTLIIVYIINKQRERKGLSKETFFSVFKVNQADK
jgi:hypothetical protein